MGMTPTEIWRIRPVPWGPYAGDPAHTTWYFYDGLDRQTCVVNPLADTTYTSDATPATQPADSEMTQYDALGDVVATTDELGRTTDFVYDNLGRKTDEIDPGPDDRHYEFHRFELPERPSVLTISTATCSPRPIPTATPPGPITTP